MDLNKLLSAAWFAIKLVGFSVLVTAIVYAGACYSPIGTLIGTVIVLIAVMTVLRYRLS